MGDYTKTESSDAIKKASKEGGKTKETEKEEGDDADWRAHVNQYQTPASYPFEIGEIVWIIRPEFRAPFGEFRISKAEPGDLFELVKISDGSVYHELVEGKFLRRDPYGVGT